MGLEADLNDALKQAMRDKDHQSLAVLRMIKTKIMERRTAKGFTGEITDEVVREVIAAYRKQLQKALEEFQKVGDKGVEQAAELTFEIGYCERFLPKGLDAAALRTLVAERIASLGITDGKQVGKLLGDIMKTHKGQVEAGDIKKLAEELLTPKA